MPRTIPTVVRAALVLLLLVPLALAGAVPATAATPVAGTAFLRLAHLSPDTPTVDIAVVGVADPTQRIDVPGVAYGAVSDYSVIPPGSYTVSMRSAGSPADAPPVITTTFTAKAGDAVTVAGLGDFAELALRVLRDDLTPPAEGQAKVRIINATPSAPTLDVRLADGPAIAEGVPYAGTSDYRTMPVGPWDVVVSRPGGPGTELPVTLDANAVYTVLLVSRDGNLAAEIRTDGAGTPATPTGSVAAGWGGTAVGASPSPVAATLLPVGLLLVLAIGTGALVRRSRAGHRG